VYPGMFGADTRRPHFACISRYILKDGGRCAERSRSRNYIHFADLLLVS
jgi:hypothetical protein